ERDPPRQRPRASLGRLRSEVRPPGARLQVMSGGRWRPVGRQGVRLSPGSHRLKVRLPDGGTVTDTVRIAAGEVSTYDRSFSKGSLRVVIQPFGSGGEVRGSSGLLATVPGPPAELYEGRHRVEIVGLDGRSKTEQVVIRPGARTTLTVALD
ncbi:MAG: hypothetical protein ACOC0J_03105, partial [Myxococcota bacterium]